MLGHDENCGQVVGRYFDSTLQCVPLLCQLARQIILFTYHASQTNLHSQIVVATTSHNVAQNGAQCGPGAQFCCTAS
jgi:hypothetical protein|eukprot:COSAG01_NODE_43_length_32320_cov_622.744763_22_plen_77_part_00